MRELSLSVANFATERVDTRDMAPSIPTGTTASTPVVPLELEADLRWKALADGCYFEGRIHMVGGPRVQPTSFHEKRAPRSDRS